MDTGGSWAVSGWLRSQVSVNALTKLHQRVSGSVHKRRDSEKEELGR
jgi:hypothetical protein